MNASTISLLEKLSNAHGTSGDEGDVRKLIQQELEGVVTFDQDKLGGLICRKPGSQDAPRIMLAAHLDEVGFMVKYITDEGLVKFHPLGGWWSQVLSGQRVIIKTINGAVPGMIGARPIHHLKEEDAKRVMESDEMFIDVGAMNKAEAEGFGVFPGDPITPMTEFRCFANPRIVCGKALDDRVGVALMAAAIRRLSGQAHPNTLFGVGSVQEEVGLRGAQTAAFRLDPDAAIVLEGAPADDLPGISPAERQGRLGGGPQIRLFDPSMIANRKFARFVIELAKKKGISHQTAVRTKGGTDAGKIHLHGSGVPTIVISTPVRYIHSPAGLLHLDDFDRTLELIIELILALDAPTVNSFVEF